MGDNTTRWDPLIVAALMERGLTPRELRDAVRTHQSHTEWFEHNPHHADTPAVSLSDDMWAIAIDDDLYPKHLANSTLAPPPVLYGRGNIHALSNIGIAIIGTRRMSKLGENVAGAAAQGAARNNTPIISGLADGCDQAAHQAALDLGLQTVAVLACGADLCYPPHAAEIANNIIKNSGAIISEQPCGTKISAPRLMARNRIIVGLSAAVVVAEAAIDSRGTIGAIGCAVANGTPIIVAKPRGQWQNHPGAQLPLLLADEHGIDPQRFGWTGNAAKNCWKHAPLAAATADDRDTLGDYIDLYVRFSGTNTNQTGEPSKSGPKSKTDAGHQMAAADS